MHVPRIPNGIIVRGGPLDGRTLPLLSDPLDTPTRIEHHDGAGVHIYTARPLGDEDEGPLWLYVHLRTEPQSEAKS